MLLLLDDKLLLFFFDCLCFGYYLLCLKHINRGQFPLNFVYYLGLAVIRLVLFFRDVFHTGLCKVPIIFRLYSLLRRLNKIFDFVGVEYIRTKRVRLTKPIRKFLLLKFILRIISIHDDRPIYDTFLPKFCIQHCLILTLASFNHRRVGQLKVFLEEF